MIPYLKDCVQTAIRALIGIIVIEAMVAIGLLVLLGLLIIFNNLIIFFLALV